MTTARISPDFERFRKVVTREALPDRIPQGEAQIDIEFMEAFLRRPVRDLAAYVSFWEKAGYDYLVVAVKNQYLIDSRQLKIAEGLMHFEAEAETSYTGGAHIRDEETFRRYPWFGPEDIYYRDVDALQDLIPEGMGLIVNTGPLYNGIQRSMGMEAFVEAYADKPWLIDMVARAFGESAVRIVDRLTGCDWVQGIWLGDDIAYGKGLLVSPDFLRTYVFPYYRRIGELCHSRNKLYIYHSDGDKAEVLDDLYDCGIQALHPNEPTSVDLPKLMSERGNQFAFIGGIDVDLLERGTPDKIARAVRKLIEDAGSGGLAVGSGNSITKHVPLENYRAMLDAVLKFGRME